MINQDELWENFQSRRFLHGHRETPKESFSIVFSALVPPAVPGEDDTRDLLMAIENAARMAEQGILSVDGGQAAVDIRSLIPARFRTATTEGLGDV